MNINIISVGKIKEDYFKAALAEYEKRLNRFCKLTCIVLPDKRIPDNPSKGECDAVLRAEGEQIMSKISKSDRVIAMCVEGKMLSSEDLAEKIEKLSFSGGDIDFVIGGSLGLWDEVKNRADFKLSLSPMTLPHRIARLVLEEQIYRAFKINANEAYHK